MKHSINNRPHEKLYHAFFMILQKSISPHTYTHTNPWEMNDIDSKKLFIAFDFDWNLSFLHSSFPNTTRFCVYFPFDFRFARDWVNYKEIQNPDHEILLMQCFVMFTPCFFCSLSLYELYKDEGELFAKSNGSFVSLFQILFQISAAAASESRELRERVSEKLNE